MRYKGRILLVDDEPGYRSIITDFLESKGHRVLTAPSGAEAIAHLEKEDFDLALLDIKMPGMSGLELLKALKILDPSLEIVMLTGHATVETAIQSMKQGAVDYLRKPSPLGDIEGTIQRTLALQALRKETFQLREGLRRSEKFPEVVGESKAIRKVLTQVDQVARTDTSVLLQGETGTGKEIVARAIHRRSRRNEKPFIVLNCGGLQENLLENDLFGHEKGAFTGAHSQKRGLLEVADGGTFFADEVAEMTVPSQARFLRVLEQGDFRRLGGNRDIRVDIRLIAATNRNLEEEVEKKRFREDLLFRLNVFLIQIPPLRQRKEDIPSLVRHFISNSAVVSGRKSEITPDAIDLFMTYGWPGNVRELANVVERALITCQKGEIRARDIFLKRGKLSGSSSDDGLLKNLEALEREHIEKILNHLEGNKRRSAQVLGISLRNLYRKLDFYGINSTREKKGGDS